MTILTTENFDDFIKNGCAVVDFWATWCGPCKMLSPVVDELEKNNKDVAFGKVNVDEYEELAVRYGISFIPALFFFKNGKNVNKIVGVKSIDELQKILDEVKA